MKYITVMPVQVWSNIWPYKFGKRDILMADVTIESTWDKAGYAFIERPVKGYIDMDALEMVADEVPLPEQPLGETTRPLFPPFVTPARGDIIQFLRDEELEEWRFKSRVVKKGYKGDGLPATVHLTGKPDFVSLSRSWQELWFELIKWQDNGASSYDRLIEIWKDVTLDRRALTDQHAWNTPNKGFSGYHDYILGTNVLARDVSQKRLGMAGNIAIALTRGKKISFAALSLAQPCPRIENIWGDHTKIWWATVSDRPNWFDGGKIDVTRPWPQIKNGVPFLNISPIGINSVDIGLIRRLGNTTSFSPYKGGG